MRWRNQCGESTLRLLQQFAAAVVENSCRAVREGDLVRIILGDWQIQKHPLALSDGL